MPRKLQKYILAIETSCDETSAAVLAFSSGRLGAVSPGVSSGSRPLQTKKMRRRDYELVAHVVSSQVKLHAKYGGVVPMLAAREQLKNMEPVLRETLRRARLTLGDIDFFSVTRGPGLIPSLHVGVNYARALAFAFKKPLIGINHIEGHIYSNWLGPVMVNSKFKIRNTKQTASSPRHSVTFPILNLVVSGGHTELVLMRGHGKYKLIGETVDDAAGEAFDKIARLLGLPYPGGPALAKLAEKGDSAAFDFPRPMINSKDLNFSFSGLKTAVLYALQKMSKQQIANSRTAVCASAQQAIVDVLVEKTLRAVKQYKVKNVFISGGVSANKKLRAVFTERIEKEMPDVAYRHPDFAYTGDNAAMISVAAYFKITELGMGNKGLRTGKQLPEVVADANLRIAKLRKM